jgi:glycosyltransferase involved in cell wall biosynthesis
MNNKIFVSVCVITYNHEKFIEEALDSVIMQSTDFDIEIIIGDDSSTDNTTSICERYAKKHNNIHHIDRKKNIGMNANWMDTIRSAKGKYIALLEGDDYWLSINKLQKQVDFLENHKRFVLCSHEIYLDNPYLKKGFTNFLMILLVDLKLNGFYFAFKKFILFFKDSKLFWKRRRLYSVNKRYQTGNLKTALQTALEKRYIHTSTIVASANILKTIPDDAFSFAIGHKITILWSAMHGLQRHFNEVMATRLVHPDASAITKREKMTDSKVKQIKLNIKLLEFLCTFNNSTAILKNKINQLNNQLE